jgi:hypothetical protein
MSTLYCDYTFKLYKCLGILVFKISLKNWTQMRFDADTKLYNWSICLVAFDFDSIRSD